MFKEDTLSGLRVLITGGGSGLGLAMAELFLRLGARVALCGRSAERLESARATLLAAVPGGDIAVRATDVRDAEQVRALFDSLSEGGGVNGLVNAAAGNFYCASEDLTPNGFRAVVDTVLVGSFNCTQQFGKRLIERKEPGAILNIVTTYTQTGSAFVLPSACAKAGVAAMTTTLAYEWATYGIRSNAIAPGPIPTEGAWQRLVPSKDFEDRYRKRLPLGRFGTPEELAHLAAFLLSDMAAYISGAVIEMDGAEHLQGGEFNFLAHMMPRDELKQLFGAVKAKSGGA